MDHATDPIDDGDATDWLDNLPPEQMAALAEILAIAQKQLDDGLGVRLTAGEVIERGRARRAARQAAE